MEKKTHISKYKTNLFVLDTVVGTSRSFWTEKEKTKRCKKTVAIIAKFSLILL